MSTKTQWTRIKIVGATIAFVAVVAAIVGVVEAVKNRAGGSSSSSSSSAASPSASTSGSSQANGTSFANHKFWGYYGANAIANHVDIRDGYNKRATLSPQLPLTYYCDTGFYDYINLAFLNIFGSQGGNPYYEFNIGKRNDTSSDNIYVYEGTGAPAADSTVVAFFEKLGTEVKYCQAKGIKVIASLGGDKSSAYSFNTGDGALYAKTWYNAFLEGSDSGTPRPFGTGVVLDGIELDIEKRPNDYDDPAESTWTPEIVSLVKTLRRLSPNTTLAAVPQCVCRLNGTDENMGAAIKDLEGVLDYIIVQYYNNPPCSYPYGFNFETNWKSNFNGPIVVGLAGDWTSAIAGGFLEEGPLQAVYDMVKTDSQFAGFSIYDVSSSNPPAFRWEVSTYPNPSVTNYSAIVYSMLQGNTVGSGYPPQGPVYVDGVNTTYRCGGTWIWAETHCDLMDCYVALETGSISGGADGVCNDGNTSGPLHCNQMISKTC
ncbi:hypothetical protein HDU83_009415 [Entophlyctis luteolus]|nr:hypothetical protein HDU83_009415 [Entophlyctis luteolus]